MLDLLAYHILLNSFMFNESIDPHFIFMDMHIYRYIYIYINY